jgi:hypothetical protein
LALSGAVAHGVVHRAMGTTVITAGCLAGELVTPWASTPTRRCSSRSGRDTGQWLIIAASLLLVVVLATTPLGSSAGVGLAIFPRLWGRWRVLGLTLHGSSALVRQAEELSDILDVMRDELL